MERLDGILLDVALGVCLDPGEGFCGCHVANHLGGEQLDEALGGHHAWFLDKLLVIAALLPGPPQRARLECGAVWQSFKLVGRLLLTRLPDPIFKWKCKQSFEQMAIKNNCIEIANIIL